MQPSNSTWEADRAFLTRLAHGLTKDDSQAEDAVQEVLLRTLHTPAPDGPARRSWLRRVLRNQLIRTWTRDGRRREREQRAARSEAVRDLRAEARLTEEELRHAFGALQEPYRCVLERRFLLDETPQEIAARLECSVDTVKTRLRRGKAHLRETLETRERGGDLRWALLAFVGEDRTRSATLGVGSLPLVPLALGALALLLGIPATLFVLGANEPAAAPQVASSTELPRAPGEDARARRAPAPGRALPASAQPGRNAARGATATPTGTAFEVPFRLVDVEGLPVPDVRMRFAPYDETAGARPPRTSAPSDAYGHGRLDAVEGWGSLVPQGERWGVLTATQIQGRAPEEPLVFVLSPRTELRGRVLDDRGRPVSDANVLLEPRVNPPTVAPPSGSRIPGYKVSTDAEGRFTARLPRTELLGVYCRRNGWPNLRTQERWPRSGEELVVVLAPDERPTVSGRVLTPEGDPAAGVWLSFGTTVVTSDDAGRFRLPVRPMLWPRTLDDAPLPVLRAASPLGWAELPLAEPDQELELRLRPAHRIGGQVTLGEAPVPGAEVWLRNRSLLVRSERCIGLEGKLASNGDERVVTDAQGAFTLLARDDRAYELIAVHPDTGLRINGLVEAGAASIDLDLGAARRRGPVQLRLRDPHGVPLEGVTAVLLAPEHEHELAGQRLGPLQATELEWARSDASGHVQFTEPPVAGCVVSLSAPGLLSRLVELEDTIADDGDPLAAPGQAVVLERTRRFRVTSPTQRSLECFALDGAGNPLPVWRVGQRPHQPWSNGDPSPYARLQLEGLGPVLEAPARATRLLVQSADPDGPEPIELVLVGDPRADDVELLTLP